MKYDAEYLEMLKEATPPGFQPDNLDLDELQFKAETFVDRHTYGYDIGGLYIHDVAKLWLEDGHEPLLHPKKVAVLSMSDAKLAAGFNRIGMIWTAMHLLSDLEDWRNW